MYFYLLLHRNGQIQIDNTAKSDNFSLGILESSILQAFRLAHLNI